MVFSESSGHRATRYAKLWVDFAWWVGVVMGGIVTIVLLIAPFVIARGVGLNEMSVTVAVDETSDARERALTSADTGRAYAVVLEEEPGGVKLSFRTHDPVLFTVANFVMLPAVIVMLYWIYLLRSILRDVLDARVFTEVNATRLTRMGWLLIFICIAMPAMSRLRSWFVLHRVQVSGAELAPFGPELSSWGVLAGLLLLSLAYVWKYGVELQRERELTV